VPEPAKLAKATLQQISWNGTTVVDKDQKGNATKPFEVDFNPQTLKMNFSNQKAGGDQPAGSSVQFVGKGTTKLSLELWFDTTAKETKGPGQVLDVRDKTSEIFKLMEPTPGTGKHKKEFIPPGVRFHWGSFLFTGVVDSMDETLEFFSSTGVPMRASVSLTLSKQELSFEREKADAEGAGTDPFQEAKAGDTFQKIAGRNGDRNWQDKARANGIENPRRLAPGALINLSATGVSAALGGPLSVGNVSLGTSSFGISGGLSITGGASLRGGVSITGGASVSAGASAGAIASLGAGATASASASFSASASASASADASASASASADASIR
jgi:hypothetical protein